MNILVSWFVSAIVILALSYLLPGISVAGFMSALLVAFVLGFLNAFIKPILIFLTLPATILTLGLFIFVINAFMVILAASIVPGFHVASFWWAFIFSVILSLTTSLVSNKNGNQDE
jgi:putative membrane protein